MWRPTKKRKQFSAFADNTSNTKQEEVSKKVFQQTNSKYAFHQSLNLFPNK